MKRLDFLLLKIPLRYDFPSFCNVRTNERKREKTPLPTGAFIFFKENDFQSWSNLRLQKSCKKATESGHVPFSQLPQH